MEVTSNNHPRRPTLPYKVHQAADPKPAAAFKLRVDAIEWARKESRTCSITYSVYFGAELLKRYFRGEEVSNG